MGRIFIIDHSTVGAGSHHLGLVECLAQAARELKFESIVGVNRKCSVGAMSHLPCESIRCFSSTVYQPISYLAGLRQIKRSRPLFDPTPKGKNVSKWRRLLDWSIMLRTEALREKFIVRFAKECAEFFAKVEFSESDHVLFATVSELELIAAMQYMAQTPKTIPASWNFLFHFNVFRGRPNQYQSQIRAIDRLRGEISDTISHLPYHRIQFYTTTETLIDQYGRLGLNGVQLFNYPVSAEFRAVTEGQMPRAPGEPLRFVAAGGVRREKGQESFLQLCEATISKSVNLSEKVQVVLQRPKRSFWQPQKLSVSQKPTLTSKDHNPIRFVDFPLPKNDYVNLIRSADCGVLLYDRENYATRCAGVLSEFLASGKPVIVSAGNWLGDQIDAAVSEHALSLLNYFTIVEETQPSTIRFQPKNVPLPGGVWSFDGTTHPFEANIRLADNAGGIMVEFQWHFPRILGTHCQWDLLVNNQPTGLSRVNCFSNDRNKSFVFFPVPFPERDVCLSLTNPTCEITQSLHKIRVFQLEKAAAQSPLGAVGIAVSGMEQVPLAFEEMVRQINHYRDTAAEFAMEWNQRHRPENSLRGMLFPLRRRQRAA